MAIELVGFLIFQVVREKVNFGGMEFCLCSLYICFTFYWPELEHFAVLETKVNECTLTGFEKLRHFP